MRSNKTMEEFSPNISSSRNAEGKVIIASKISKSDSAIQFSKKELKLIDSILLEYGNMSADDLSDITHSDNGLWDIAIKNITRISKNHVDDLISNWI